MILYNRSLVHLALGQPDKALADDDTVLELDANFVRAHYVKAQALEKIGNKYEAMADFRQFLKAGNPEKDPDLLRKALAQLNKLEENKSSGQCQCQLPVVQYTMTEAPAERSHHDKQIRPGGFH